ncbi:MAG: amino acid permease [Bacteroidia bacterium]
MRHNNVKKMGLLHSTALVIGNMIGSGIFLLPASLAVYGNKGLLGWLFSFAGAMLLAVIFGNLSKLIPAAAGGPYEYAKHEFGKGAAYIVAWSYWTSIWFANAAIVVALLGYLTVFFPFLAGNVVATVLTGWFFIWLFTWINTQNIQFVGKIQLLTTLLKIIPLLIVGVVGLFYIDYQTISLAVEWDFATLTAATTLTFFAFLGMESAAITSDQISGDETTVKKATVAGTFLTSLIYMTSSFAVMALVRPEVLASSTSPFADASMSFLGSAAKYIVAAGAVFSTCGALNGWTLIQGHIPMAAADDGLFPKIFGERNNQNSPSKGIVITSVIISLLLLLNYIKGLVSLFTLLIALSTLSVMIPYLFSVAAYFFLMLKNKQHYRFYHFLLPFSAFLFLAWIIVGSGWETIFYGISFIMVGVIFYFFVRFTSE